MSKNIHRSYKIVIRLIVNVFDAMSIVCVAGMSWNSKKNHSVSPGNCL